jgi:hypothetical protein
LGLKREIEGSKMKPELNLSPQESFEFQTGAWSDELETLPNCLQDASSCISVVIVTLGRPQLEEAMESVYQQDFTGTIRLLVIGDNCQKLPINLPTPPHIKLTVGNTRLNQDGNPYHRVARLRNIACCLVNTRFFCFLDDDNLWEKDHISTLIDLIQKTGFLAVHSWRKLINHDGKFVIPNRYPWLPSGSLSEQMFSIYCQHGVMNPNDSIIRDRSTLNVGEQDYGMVDMGEWLFDRELFSLIQFNEDEPSGKHQLHSGEDDKLLRDLKKLAVPTACTSKPTLLYRLGGFSNDFTK